MNKKLFYLIVLVMALSIVMCGCGSSDSESGTEAGSVDTGKTYNFKIAAQESEEHNDVKSIMRVAEAIAEQTDGHVNITVYPSNQLGDYTQVYDEVMAGTIDMACITIPTTYDSRLEMLTIPYLTTNYQEAIDNFLAGSEFFNKLTDIQLEKGVQTLAVYLDGYMGIGATKSINKVMDYNDSHSGILMRCPSVDSYIWTAQAMNYGTTTIAYADLYSALQTGVCDGWVGGSAYVNYLNFRDVVKYFCDSRYIMELITVVINADAWNSLPEEYQKIISNVFYEESVSVANAREELDNKAMDDMAAMGIEIYVPTNEELNAMRNHFQETVWPKYKDALGDELYNLLLSK
ncbi:MAG: TRAP transporter substrate-binding protein DctP [Dehalobacterium sp.]